jgi:hypothetical protein
MRFFNHRGAFFEDEWLSVVDGGLFRLVVSQLWNRRQLAPEPLPERRIALALAASICAILAHVLH